MNLTINLLGRCATQKFPNIVGLGRAAFGLDAKPHGSVTDNNGSIPYPDTLLGTSPGQQSRSSPRDYENCGRGAILSRG